MNELEGILEAGRLSAGSAAATGPGKCDAREEQDHLAGRGEQ